MRIFPVSRHLAALAILVLVPQIALGGYLVYRNARYAQLAIENSADALARTLSDSVDRELVGLGGILRGLASSTSLKAQNWPAFLPRVKAAFEGRPTAGVALRDSAGKLLFNSNAAPGAPLPPSNPELRDFDRRVLEADGPVVSGVHVGAVARRPLVLVGLPVRLDDDQSYVLATALDPNRILEVVRGTALPEGWLAVVMDRNRRVVARSRDSEAFVGRSASPEFLVKARGDVGRVLSTTLDGDEVFTAYVVSEASGWLVLVSAPKAIAEAPLRMVWWSLAALAALALLSSLAGALFFGRLIGDGLRGLAAEATDLGESRVPRRARTSVAEIEAVHESLIESAAELARRADHQSMLMAELDHRVKNTLAIIQSLVTRTMRSAPDPEQGTRSLHGRVMALARSHEVLSEAGWTSVSLEAVVGAIASANEAPIRFSGPEVRLQPRAVVAVAQSLHELATNARRHAAKNSVDLSWRIHDENLVLEWVERNGTPEAEPVAGFGRDIVRLCIERQLGGVATFSSGEDGFRLEAHIPIRSDQLGENLSVGPAAATG